jgi:Putative zinc-finger
MSRFPRLRRRRDEWSDPHERARVRAAERLDGPLGLAESSWLEEHLAGCPACVAIAAEYTSDREALRALRDEQPEPPRDLWARTAAAIEQLSNDAGDGDAEPRPSTRRRLRALPVGAMSAVAVVVVLVGATLLSKGIAPGAGTGALASGALRPPAASLVPPAVALGGAEPTPFAVRAGDVAWVDTGSGGVSFSNVQVEQVCPAEGASGCPAVQDRESAVLDLSTAPRSLIGAPSKQQAVAIAKADGSGDELVVVQLPQKAPAASASPTPAGTIEPSATSTEQPQVPESVAPSPSVTVLASESPAAPQSPSPQPTAAELAIARGILVVGESAAFSADGSWFAFTARPGDASRGPDVWVWRVGDPQARQLTNDGVSYFASWSGDRAVISRPADPAADTSAPSSVIVDPSTGAEQPVGELWRPMVDPSGRLAIAWRGSLEHADDPLLWTPAHGRLELRSWSSDGDAGGVDGSAEGRVVAESAHGDFDVRWDETGQWVAVWVADERDASSGRLTLYRLDTRGRRLERVEGAPKNVRSLPGFSIGAARLAWATPRGSGGEGSRVQIAAWSTDGIGIVASGPGEDVRIIR